MSQLFLVYFVTFVVDHSAVSGINSKYLFEYGLVVDLLLKFEIDAIIRSQLQRLFYFIFSLRQITRFKEEAGTVIMGAMKKLVVIYHFFPKIKNRLNPLQLQDQGGGTFGI